MSVPTKIWQYDKTYLNNCIAARPFRPTNDYVEQYFAYLVSFIQIVDDEVRFRVKEIPIECDGLHISNFYERLK